jgi:hypothetical protein
MSDATKKPICGIQVESCAPRKMPFGEAASGAKKKIINVGEVPAAEIRKTEWTDTADNPKLKNAIKGCGMYWENVGEEDLWRSPRRWRAPTPKEEEGEENARFKSYKPGYGVRCSYNTRGQKCDRRSSGTLGGLIGRSEKKCEKNQNTEFLPDTTKSKWRKWLARQRKKKGQTAGKKRRTRKKRNKRKRGRRKTRRRLQRSNGRGRHTKRRTKRRR